MERTFGVVNLQPAKPLLEAVDAQDNWTGISNSAARRKAQNRLNQRARRRRKDPDKWTPLRSRIDDMTGGTHPAEPSPAPVSVPVEPTTWSEEPCPVQTLALVLAKTSPCGRQTTSSPPLVYFPLSTDHLMHLIQFNVYRAVLTNMFTLRTAHIFSCETHPAGWVHISALPLPQAIPPTLEPTALQRQVPHAPYVDLFPLPALRDALIRAEGTFDDCDLCIDLLGSIAGKHVENTRPALTGRSSGESTAAAGSPDDERKGLVIWGEPWSAASWEVEEGFARKWGWMLQDNCEELLQATDRWRQLRGEEPLRWADMGIKC